MADKLYQNEAWLREQYLEKELSSYEIAKLCDSSSCTIISYLKKHGIPVRSLYGQGCRTERTKARMRNARIGKSQSEKVKNRISESLKLKYQDSDFKTEHSQHMTRWWTHPEVREKLMPFLKSDEHRAFISKNARKRWENPEYKLRHSGENSHLWKGGISFKPYCPKFSNALKEAIREQYGRRCVICGAIETNKKHSVHHIDYNKMQGCNNQRWLLIPLCQSCHAKTSYNRWHWFNMLVNHWAINPDITFGWLI